MASPSEYQIQPSWQEMGKNPNEGVSGLPEWPWGAPKREQGALPGCN